MGNRFLDARYLLPRECPLAFGATILVLWACAAPDATAREPTPAQVRLHELSVPAAPGSLGPNLAATSHGVFLSWLEPAEQGETGSERHALRVAHLDPRRPLAWGAPVSVTEGEGFFANWADFPALAEIPGGGLLVHWLERTGEDTYAYGVRLARSLDRGQSWEPLGFLHDDLSPTEHGFVSFAPMAEGVRAFWLDGRDMAAGGPMALRTVLVAGSAAAFDERGQGPPSSTVLDGRVCECCQTDAAVATRGPVVVYRGRSDDEVRDIWIVRAVGDGWSPPQRVSEDGWRIPGCPVNGPAVAAAEDRVVVAWFTGANDQPAVKTALSTDGGATFGPALELDAEAPIGRVDVAVTDNGAAWVTWLARTPEGAAVRLAALRLGESDRPTQAGPPATLASTGGARSSGFPRILALDLGRLLVTWVDTANGQRVRAAWVELAD